MLDIMRRQHDRARLARLLPRAVEFAHKTGSEPRVSDDAGVLYAPASACIVSVFMRDRASDLEGATATGHVGRAVYDAYAI